MIMTKVLRSGGSLTQEHWKWGSRAIFNFVRYRRVFGAIIQSAAIYSVASISLLVTVFVSPNIAYPTCLDAFPPLIVRLSPLRSRTRISLLTMPVCWRSEYRVRYLRSSSSRWRRSPRLSRSNIAGIQAPRWRPWGVPRHVS